MEGKRGKWERMGNDEIYCVDRGIPSCFNYRSRVASSDFFSLSFPFFLFSFDRGRQSKRLESQAIKFDLDSTLFFSCLLELDLSFLYIRCISWQEVGKKRQR